MFAFFITCIPPTYCGVPAISLFISIFKKSNNCFTDHTLSVQLDLEEALFFIPA